MIPEDVQDKANAIWYKWADAGPDGYITLCDAHYDKAIFELADYILNERVCEWKMKEDKYYRWWETECGCSVPGGADRVRPCYCGAKIKEVV